LKLRGIIKGEERGRKKERKKEGCRLSAAGMRDTLPVASCADGGSFLAGPPQKRTKKARLWCWGRRPVSRRRESDPS